MSYSNVYELNVDLKQTMTSVIPTFAQDETGVLQFRIFDNGQDVDMSLYTYSEIIHKLPSGKKIMGNLDLVTVNGEKLLEYRYTGLEMAELGKVEVQLIIQSADTNVVVRPFKVIIYENMSDDELTYVGILQELITEVSLLKEEMYKAINSWVFRNSYNANTQYYKYNIVEHQGSSWIAIRATKGNTPPPLPTISNLNWHLIAKKADDGVSQEDFDNLEDSLQYHISETSKYTVITSSQIQTIVPNQEVDINWTNIYQVNNSDFARLENNRIVLKKGTYIYFCYMGMTGDNTGVRKLRINNLTTTFNNNAEENVILMSSLVLDVANDNFTLPTKLFQNASVSLNTIPINNLIRILKVSD